MHKFTRKSKEEYYINIAKEVSSRSTCYRAKHWIVIVKDDQIISTWYVWAPRKTKDCLERWNCLREELQVPSGERYELCRSVHAEQNAIINAARSGANLFWATMYHYTVRLDKQWNEVPQEWYPCLLCKKMIINAWIKHFTSIQADWSIKTHNVEDWVTEWQNWDLVSLGKK